MQACMSMCGRCARERATGAQHVCKQGPWWAADAVLVYLSLPIAMHARLALAVGWSSPASWQCQWHASDV